MEDKGWKGRKIILFFILLVFSSVGYWMGKMTASEWIGFAEWLFGLYVLGNVGQKGLLKYFQGKREDREVEDYHEEIPEK